ncbi:MAG: LacI family DNA-binding transcriptional regulator [Sphaerochaeta sp.]|uniref:LacI family DNA-binding transcriptional regulator n=1 Tax=Sphaerochaeta sp. TaxID=1972642 RepID=UPI002FCB29BD
MPKTSLKQIAQEAHVSVTVVSLVLNNKAKENRISDETRDRILAIAQREQYIPNRLASALQSKRSNIIAIVVPFTPVGFFVELIYHIEQYAMAKGYQAMVINTFNDEKKERESLGLYRSGLFDGMLIASLNNSSPSLNIYRAMQNQLFPFVFVDRFAEGIKADVVSSDHFHVAYEMTTQMLETGKRDILMLTRGGQAMNSTAKLRIEGYEAAMREKGLEPWEASFQLLSGEVDGQTTIASVLAELTRKPEAIFLHSGYYMPHLIKVYGDSPFKSYKAEFMTVDQFSFTQDLMIQKDLLEHVVGHFFITIQDIKQIAQRACDILLEKIEHTNQELEAKTIHIPTKTFWG